MCIENISGLTGKRNPWKKPDMKKDHIDINNKADAILIASFYYETYQIDD